MSDEEANFHFENLVISSGMNDKFSNPLYVYDEKHIELVKQMREIVKKRIRLVSDLSDKYSTLSSGCQNAIFLAVCSEQSGDLEEAEMYRDEARHYAKMMIDVRQEACQHEFIKGQGKCCRCGITKTPELQ